MTGHLLTVGDEILLGQIIDTNAAWLGEALADVGVDVRRSETIGDDEGAIVASIERATAEGATVLIVTGGLGATHDDVTRAAVARAFGRELEVRPDLHAALEARYRARGRAVPPRAHVMAEAPAGFEALPNPKGAAPGLWGEREVDGRTQMVAVLPGVPHEMRAIAEGSVLPRLRARQDGVVLSRTLLTAGEGESDLAARLGDLTATFRNGLTLAFLPGLGSVRLRVTVRGADRGAARDALDRATDQIREALGDLVFGEGTTTLEAVVLDQLRERGLTLAVAESCSGGAVAARITTVPGASRVLRGGVVAYCNSVKVGLLGVDAEVLAEDGAVSERVALQMARGARDRLGADVGVATTGIAGPGGGTPEKPVGTVWLAYADAETSHAVGLRFTPDRDVNIGLTTTAALDLVRRQLLRKDRAEAAPA